LILFADAALEICLIVRPGNGIRYPADLTGIIGMQSSYDDLVHSFLLNN
jgi:hypothetical protein